MSNSWDRGLLENDNRPLPVYVRLSDAKARARRAFWGGLLIGVAPMVVAVAWWVLG